MREGMQSRGRELEAMGWVGWGHRSVWGMSTAWFRGLDLMLWAGQ